jgi:hypothetical protein
LPLDCYNANEGAAGPSLAEDLPIEFVAKRWRARLDGLPDATRRRERAVTVICEKAKIVRQTRQYNSGF